MKHLLLVLYSFLSPFELPERVDSPFMPESVENVIVRVAIDDVFFGAVGELLFSS